jgi:hypothetical protein
VAYQARLESVCSRKVTVGSNPTLSALSVGKLLEGLDSCRERISGLLLV